MIGKSTTAARSDLRPWVGETRWLIQKTAVMALIFGLAYLLRALFPDLIMTGYDMPAHTMASLRLHLTSPFAADHWLNNTLAQAVLYNHGYTTMLLPWLLYETAFSLLGLPVTETNLVLVNSLLGMLSLASIFWFVSLHLDFRRSAAITALTAVTAIHIGLSRVHVGTQMVSSILFFTCLSLLHLYLEREDPARRAGERRGRKWQYLYYLAVFFYIGSENIFPVGLALQALYAVLMGTRSPRREWFALLRRLYLHPLALLAIGLPVSAYVAAAAYALYYNLDGGYLLRLLSKRSSLSLGPVRPVTWMLDLFGPVFAFAIFLQPLRVHTHPVSVRWALRKDEDANRFGEFLVSMFAIYFLFLSISSNVEDNYIYTLLVPMMIAAGLFLTRHWALYAVGLLLTLGYAVLVVYNPNIELPIPIKKNYGTVMSWQPRSDHAIKTAGYLFREGALNISTFQRGPVTWAGFFGGHQQAFYYFGAQTPRWVARDIQDGALDAFERYLLADSVDARAEEALFLHEVIDERKLQRVGVIADGSRALVVLYSNRPSSEIFALDRLPGKYTLDDAGNPVFDIHQLNPLFDQEYASMDRLPRAYLGQWGFHFPGRANDSPVLSE